MQHDAILIFTSNFVVIGKIINILCARLGGCALVYNRCTCKSPSQLTVLDEIHIHVHIRE